MSSSFEPSGGSGNCQNSSSVYCFTSGDIFTHAISSPPSGVSPALSISHHRKAKGKSKGAERSIYLPSLLPFAFLLLRSSVVFFKGQRSSDFACLSRIIRHQVRR